MCLEGFLAALSLGKDLWGRIWWEKCCVLFSSDTSLLSLLCWHKITDARYRSYYRCCTERICGSFAAENKIWPFPRLGTCLLPRPWKMTHCAAQHVGTCWSWESPLCSGRKSWSWQRLLGLQVGNRGAQTSNNKLECKKSKGFGERKI